jgi:N-acetylated-alpha-linked acidic dipeptidase
MGWVCGVGLALAGSLLAQSTVAPPEKVFGFRDYAASEARWDKEFLAVPDPALAREHLKRLTGAPHWASSPEDYQTALYVADKFKAAGLATEIVPYRVQMNKPVKILVEAFAAGGARIMSGPTPEHVDPSVDGGDPFQDDKRILPAFSGSSPSGDVTGVVVYANYGTLADFKRLEAMGVQVRDRIVLVRYGANFRGVKVYLAQQRGAKGVLIYSDPADDGSARGDVYPKGPYRPESAVQRGSAQFLPIFPGDPTTPGYASVPDLPDSKRVPPGKAQIAQPSIPVNPLSFKDAEPILEAMGGPSVPANWQGGGGFNYRLGAKGKKAVKVHMHLEQEIALRTIWDVIGTIPGTGGPGTGGAERDDLVIAGNHRDAWVYGAVDPNSGTAAMLEAVHGLGELLKSGWRPRRTLLVASWDAEEEGLIGSVEWVEQHPELMRRTVAYLNTDVGVSGPSFSAAAVPSLKEFVSDVTREVPSPLGGTVHEQWRLDQQRAHPKEPVVWPRIDALGSGSDYTPFLQHAGVAATDIGSNGPYGVYHSAFDDFNWFVKNADPDFLYEQQQARVFGLEMLHMADADVLPMDFGAYGTEVVGYLAETSKKAEAKGLKLDFAAAQAAAQRFAAAGAAVRTRQDEGAGDLIALNRALREAEVALLLPRGLPGRGWYRHSIYSPGEYTGYQAVVIPGVNEAVTLGDTGRAQGQMQALADALGRASAVLETVR